ncbi:MAG: GNAT family N-acetyltransferase [Planctomycetes bacterium]|nr:GNAT family N-acetyltransferase [Planctomycetota bacterium]
MSTAKRQGFEEYSEDYIQRMYDEFAAQGWAKLFLVEHQEELVSGLIAIPFGDTVLFKKGAWTGQHGPLCPNEAMHWHAICWAKNAGYRYYDFGGIDRATAEPLCRGVAVSRKQMDQVSRFKIGFGGQVTLMPETLAFPSNALLRWIYQASYRKASQSRILQKMFHKFKFG